jgi:hypothetical protein
MLHNCVHARRCSPDATDSSAIAFSSEVDTGSREENASKQQTRASLLIRSEVKILQPFIFRERRFEAPLPGLAIHFSSKIWKLGSSRRMTTHNSTTLDASKKAPRGMTEVWPLQFSFPEAGGRTRYRRLSQPRERSP